MRNASALRQILVSLALAVAGLLAWQPAAQASIDDFINVYKQIEAAAPPNSLPVSSADIIAYKSLFECVEGGNDVVICTDQFHDTNAGKNASDQAGIPESIWQVVDAYVAWKNGDVWGVVEHLGAAAACAVLQVLAGGYDVCGLIQDLYDAAKDALDAGKAVAEFFASIGEDVWSGVKSVGCAIGLGGCGDDSPPPPPPEVSAYNQYFAPKVKDLSALKARESPDPNAFATLVLQTSNAAHQKYAYDAVAKAAALFTKEVNKQWTGDIPKVLPELAQARTDYNAQKAQHIAVGAADAAAAYLSSKIDPRQRAEAHCVGDFPKFLHVDYWVAQFPAMAQQLHVSPTTANWCSKFWYDNVPLYGTHFHSAMSALCPSSGSTLLCATTKNYEKCLGLMGSVGLNSQCVPNVKAVGNDIAKEIVAYFKKNGSKYPCDAPMLSTPGSTAPAVLRCYRPTQQYHCDKYYHDHYGSGPNKLPVKVLQCALGAPLRPQGYEGKESTTWQQIVPKMLSDHPGAKTYLSPKGPDPLVIAINNPQVYSELAADAAKYGVQTQVVMVWEPTIDGVETATLERNIGGGLNQMTKPAAIGLGGVNPESGLKGMTGKVTQGQMAAPSAKLGAAPGAFAGAGAPTKPMSGSLPPGFGAPPGRLGRAPLKGGPRVALAAPSLAVVRATARVEQNCRAPLPALVVEVTVRNSGAPLAAGAGKLSVKETGGARLASAELALPAIGGGQVSAPLRVPVTTPEPYASLAGGHTLEILLEPARPGARPSALSVNVPPGHCAIRALQRGTIGQPPR